MKKTGLGKGLDALFSGPITDDNVMPEDIVKSIKITDFEPVIIYYFI